MFIFSGDNTCQYLPLNINHNAYQGSSIPPCSSLWHNLELTRVKIFNWELNIIPKHWHFEPIYLCYMSLVEFMTDAQNNWLDSHFLILYLLGRGKFKKIIIFMSMEICYIMYFLYFNQKHILVTNTRFDAWIRILQLFLF